MQDICQMFFFTFVILVSMLNVASNDPGPEPIVLWWTEFTGIKDGEERICASGRKCFFTENRDLLGMSGAVLFYGSNFNVTDLPLPRNYSEKLWCLMHEESPKNQPIFDHLLTLQLFNISSTFSRNSDVPLTLQYLESMDSLTDKEEFVITSVKNILQSELSPIVYIQSSCDAPSERDRFVTELSQFIPVDSYGKCLHNRNLPGHLLDRELSIYHHDLKALVGKYKFTLALENAACDDYITEKLWRPLTAGSIPIYWGSISVKDWIPNSNSIISVRDFSSPKHLADYLHTVLKNNTLYEEFLEHKLKGMVTNPRLLDALHFRQWGINNDRNKVNFVEHFECKVCDILHKIIQNPYVSGLQVEHNHYGCPEPEAIFGTSSLFWREQWHKSRLEAKVMQDVISAYPKTFTPDQFNELVLQELLDDTHFLNLQNELENISDLSGRYYSEL